MKRTDNTLNALFDMAVRDGHDANSRPKNGGQTTPF